MSALLLRFDALRRLAPLACLLLLLQRTPVLQLLLRSEAGSSTAIVNLLRTALLAAAGTAAHTLTGATALTANPTSPASATVGTTFNLIFAVTGAQAPAGSYEITGTLAPGLTITGMNTSTGLLNASSGTITGTPTTAGSYTIHIQAWQNANKGGDTNNVLYDLTINVTGTSIIAPSITSQPSSATVNVGGSATFSVTASGTAPLAYQWKKDGNNVSGGTSASLALTNIQTTAAGSYTVVVSNSAGSATSNAATLTVNVPNSTPTITTQPRTFHVPAGYTGSFSVTAAGTAPLTYQWKKDGLNVVGATTSTLSIPNAHNGDAATYTVTITNGQGTVTSTGADLVVGSSSGRVPAISMRARVGTGSEILVPGLVVGNGPSSQTFLVRALGPKLGDFGIDAATRLGDPLLKITLLDGTIVAQNDNWSDNTNAAAIVTATATVGAQALTAGSKDAVLLTTLAPGIYTPQISGVGNTTGVSLVEFYNVDSSNKVPAISMRARVGTGSEILVPGLVVEGSSPKMFLIRALGPKLGDFGIDANTHLKDPLLKVTLLDGTVIAQNDNWEENANASLIPTIATVLGAQPLNAGSKDAVLLIALPPGIYTPQISGVGGTSGVSLVEFYNVE